ncbi:hypothetical protein [Streptomyces sp. NPDC014006]|uniref:hypothetical protein n=1 Tax=Streptomyces sp. NPDC014006 TaxID=3364870 RepID=UPI003701E9E0
MDDEVPDAVTARPWCPQDGPKPVVWTWPSTDPPALWVRAAGRWRRAVVRARQDWPDGRVIYQVLVDAEGTGSKGSRAYPWPQNGLRVAHRSALAPFRDAQQGGGLPRPPSRRVRSAVARPVPPGDGDGGAVAS